MSSYRLARLVKGKNSSWVCALTAPRGQTFTHQPAKAIRQSGLPPWRGEDTDRGFYPNLTAMVRTQTQEKLRNMRIFQGVVWRKSEF